MRYGCIALLMLISSATTTSAQVQTQVTAPAPTVMSVPPQMLSALRGETRVTPDQVVARLMTFDRNGDGRVDVAELSERMQDLIARGDRGGDGALDAAEIRSMAASPQFVQTAFRNLHEGGYGFGDTVGLSTRTHIENTIEDLRLAPQASEETKRIALAFVDELEGTALANLRRVVTPMLTEAQLFDFESSLKSSRSRTFTMVSNDGTRTTQTFAAGVDAAMLLSRYQLTPEQRKAVAEAAVTFKAEQQLNDARRSALVAQLRGILTDEESDNFRAALARRPLVKAPGVAFNVVRTAEVFIAPPPSVR
jgi:hypothetical protein